MFPTDIRHVAFAGDWHADTIYADQILESIRDRAQVVLHTGDFGYHFADLDLDAFQRSAERVGMKIMFVDGNHENFDRLLSYPIDPVSGVRMLRPDVWHLPRGFRWTWSGLRFLALGGAPSVDKAWRREGLSWWTQETITDADAYRAVEGGRADIMVCHDTPAGYDIPGLLPEGTFPAQAYVEAAEHRRLLRRIVDEVQPKFLWHGHYHSFYQDTVPLSEEALLVTGLNCNGSPPGENIHVVDLQALIPYLPGGGGR